MFASRRCLLLGLIVLGSQIATGCCYNRPVLFPRLQYCGPGASLLNRPLLAPAASAPVPVVSGPVYDGGYGGVPVSTPPVYGGGCTTCGSGGYGGIPIAGAPNGIPIAGTQPGYSYPVMTGAGVAAPPSYVNPNASVPLNMPTAMPGGVPFDSSLAPTVKPPVNGANPTDSKKLVTAGK